MADIRAENTLEAVEMCFVTVGGMAYGMHNMWRVYAISHSARERLE